MPVMPGAEPFHHDGGSVGVLLCHGFTGTPQSLRPWAEHLAAAGLTVALPRLPGHGTTLAEANLTHWEDWYAELDRPLAQLRERCDEVFVMGLSMGGTLAIRLAELHGDDDRRAGAGQPEPADQAARPVPPAGAAPGRPDLAGHRQRHQEAGCGRAGLRQDPGQGVLPAQPALADHPRRPRQGDPADADLPVHRGPRRRAGQLPDVPRQGSLHRRARGAARGQLPRRHPRQRRADHLRGQRRVRPRAGEDARSERLARDRAAAHPVGTTACTRRRTTGCATSRPTSSTASSTGCATSTSPPTARRRRASAAPTATRSSPAGQRRRVGRQPPPRRGPRRRPTATSRGRATSSRGPASSRTSTWTPPDEVPRLAGERGPARAPATVAEGTPDADPPSPRRRTPPSRSCAPRPPRRRRAPTRTSTSSRRPRRRCRRSTPSARFAWAGAWAGRCCWSWRRCSACRSPGGSGCWRWPPSWQASSRSSPG